MVQIHLINAVVEWERRLQIEEETRKNLRGEPYKVFTSDPQPDQKKRKSFFERIFKSGRDHQPVHHGYTHKPCRESQPGC